MKKIFKIGLMIVFLTGFISSQYFFDQAKAKTEKHSPLVLQPKTIRLFDLGLHNVAADYFWLSSIQYFGDWQNDKYQAMDDFLEATIELDPKFSYPYAFAPLSLSNIGMVDKAIEIAEKGIDLNLKDWRIPYFLGAIYFTEKKDIAMAAKYFDLAAHTEGAPNELIKVSASFSARPDSRESIKNIWIAMYENSKDETARERAKSYIYHYEILDLLENASKLYQDRYSAYPASLDELVSRNILKAIPEDPFGFKYEIDNNGRAIIKQ